MIFLTVLIKIKMGRLLRINLNRNLKNVNLFHPKRFNKYSMFWILIKMDKSNIRNF